jgi:cytochrome b561
MMMMPLSGYLSIANYLSFGNGNIQYFFLCDLIFLKGIALPEFLGLTFKQLEKPAEQIHKLMGQWVVSLFILGHVSAALYHHYVQKNNTLTKMTFNKD